MDPFDAWYARQIDTDDDENYKPSEWDLCTLEWDATSKKDPQEERITLDKIDSWVDRLVRFMKQAEGTFQLIVEQQTTATRYNPGIDFIIARHKDLGKKDVKHGWRPFRASQFYRIVERLHLSPQYLYLRTNGSANSGAVTFHVHRDDTGRVSRISSIIRPAHGSVTRFSSFWAFALTWDSSTGRTTGFLDGVTQSDLSQLKFLLRSCAAQLVHPLTIPEIFLHMIVAHLNDRIRVPGENEFHMEERRTGLARVKLDSPDGQKSIWTWSFHDFQNSMAVANKFLPTLAYLRRRFAYATQLTQRLLSVLDELDNFEFSQSDVKVKVQFGALERRERLLNRMGILENYSHQTECMLQRTENTITVLSTTLNQIDSRNQAQIAKGNLQIAHAVRTDSIPMRTIAYVTLIVLPGAFVAAIFGMNFFLFDPEQKSLVVADTFWQYWAVTIPLTIFVLVIWNIWVYIEKHKGSMIVADEESLAHLPQSLSSDLVSQNISVLQKGKST